MLVDTDKVKCDITGELLSGDFVYYSVTGERSHFDGRTARPDKSTKLDIDICESAFKGLVDQCRQFAGKGDLNCNLTGVPLAGGFWMLSFDRVEVSTSKANPQNGEIPLTISKSVMDMKISDAAANKLMAR